LAKFANLGYNCSFGASLSSLGDAAMPTRNVNLTQRYDQFVEEQIDAGRFRNASEVMRAGLRLLEQQTREEEEKLELLRTLARDAFAKLDQGLGIEVKSWQQLDSLIGRIGRRAGALAKRRPRKT
jgi:antitoxin ParD1/3/4